MEMNPPLQLVVTSRPPVSFLSDGGDEVVLTWCLA